MFTQELYLQAIKFAGEKHAKQTYPGTDANYLVHVSMVAMEIMAAYFHSQDFDIDFAVQMALLHDTLEDTDASYSELMSGFGEKVAQGIRALTKDKSIEDNEERMIDSLKRINALDKEVGMVKLADRISNLQPPPPNWDKIKIQLYYNESLIISKSLGNRNSFLYNRLLVKMKEYKKYFT